MKDKIVVIMFLCYVFVFSILHIAIKDEVISSTERRTLSTFPTFKLSSEYLNDIDKYLLDHFPFRDNFRSLKAKFNYNILRKLDNNDIYLKDDLIFKSEYPTNKDSINRYIKTINNLKSKLNKNNNVYISIIPDKNYYLKDDYFLNIDYNYIYEEIKNIDASYIDLRNILKLEDYYKTDTHWKQENISKVVSKIVTSMGKDYIPNEYSKHEFNKFYGVYYGESAINRDPELLTYLSNDIIDNAVVKYLENNKLNKVYNIDKLDSLDSYQVFLDGASSFIEIDNPNYNGKSELVIFRDSFASSITPLLIPYYSKITLIDNRYINSDNFMKLINFDDQDVLFLNSTLIVNNSSTLKN